MTQPNFRGSWQAATFKAGIVRRARAWMRLALTGAVLLALALIGLAREAHATLGEALVRVGGDLLAWEQARPNSPPRTLLVNGLSIGVLSLTVNEPPAAVLDRFQDHCRAHGGLSSSEGSLGTIDLSLRKESATEGVVACLDMGHPLTWSELGDRARRVAETGDFSSLGHLRYMLVRGRGARTNALVLWADGPLSAAAFGSAAQDAPGRDPLDLPRMPGLVRRLSAAEAAQPYSVTVYQTEQGRDAVRDWYDRALRGAGWAVDRTEYGFAIARGGRTAWVRVRATSQGKATVSVFEFS